MSCVLELNYTFFGMNWRILCCCSERHGLLIALLTLILSFTLQIDGISIRSLDDIPAGPITSFFRSVRNTLDFDFEDENEGR